MKIKAILVFLLCIPHYNNAQNFSFNFNTTGKRVCLVESEVNLSVPSVTIKLLDAASNASSSSNIFRRPLHSAGSGWVQVATALTAGTPQWIDTDVQLGEAWEYQVKRTGTWLYQNQQYDATGYTIGSLLKDNTQYQGQMILLIADNIVNGLPAKYTRLKKELTGEGWFVNEIIVPKASGWDGGSTIVGIRSQVAAIYNNAPAGDKPKVLFILGHVPMPRSGSSAITAPDDHDQNKGARGFDGYYADIDGIYTDTATFNPGGLQTPLAQNFPGDFRWDQDFFSSGLEMGFGRVDFEDIIDNPLTELQLTEQYLDRLSNYRRVSSGYNMGGKTGFFFGYDNSNDGSFRSLPGISKSSQLYQNTTNLSHPQWVQQNGPFKVYMQNAGFPQISEWNTFGMDATVFSSDQSYWGFNDVPQEFYYSRIRGLLAVDTKCLVALWTTTGVNTFHQACSGEPLGLSVKETIDYNIINNNMERPQQQWDTADWWNRTHMTYNGDPTLRLYQAAPASNFAIANNNNAAILSWNASPDPGIIGYHIYKSPNEFGKYERITNTPINTLNYTDTDYIQNTWYMLRPVKIEESGCGKFLNPGLGIFVKGDFNLSITENHFPKPITIYPNPADSAVTIKSENIIETVQLTTMDGRVAVLFNNVNSPLFTFDISTFPAGIYAVKITSSNKTEFEMLAIK